MQLESESPTIDMEQQRIEVLMHLIQVMCNIVYVFILAVETAVFFIKYLILESMCTLSNVVFSNTTFQKLYLIISARMYKAWALQSC